MNKIAIYGALLVACVVIVAVVAHGKSNLHKVTTSSVEEQYLLRVADFDHDGVLSDAERAKYRQVQEEITRSQGELTLSQDGELVVADKFAHDEEARAAFEQRQHMKD